MPLEGWPTRAGPERARRILEEVEKGNYDHSWCPLELSDGSGGTLRLEVSCDALRIEGVRVTAGALTQQAIADKLGALLLTPRLYDQVYLKAPPSSRMTPHTFGEPRTTTARMIEHSRAVDAEAATKGSPSRLVNVGKVWAITNKIFTPQAIAARKAANHGWVSPSGEPSQATPSLRVIQDIGTAHNTNEDITYEQNMLFVRRKARYGELPVDVADVYLGKAPGNALVSHEGPLKGYRQPGSSTPPLVEEPPPRPPVVASAPPPSIAVPVGLGAAAGAVGYAAAGAQGGFWGAVGGFVLGLLASRRS